MMISLILAVILVFITLLIEFLSFAHPVTIITRGMVVKNGILMVDAVEDHLAAGDTLREALLRSGRRRFRPVLMTSLAAIFGMLPLALALGSGAELLQPLAIAVIGGLAVALLLSLVVTPTVYAMLSGEHRI